jgi:tetratricopeptide (TPR) repeat protein
MTAQKADAYRQDPDYLEAQQCFQNGDWKSGLVKLKALLDIYPYSSELRSMFVEMQLRAKVDVYEREDKRFNVRKLATRGLLSLAGLVVLSFFALWGFQSSTDAIRQWWINTQEGFERVIEQQEIDYKYQNAEALMNAYYIAEARDLFLEVKAEQGDYKEVDIKLENLSRLEILQREFENAAALANEGREREALGLFQWIDENEPNFRFVTSQIERLEKKIHLDEALGRADRAFSESRWAEAAAAYLSLKEIDPNFRPIYVEEQLFQSYRLAARSVLDDPSGTLADLRNANSYFDEALKLRPQDRQILRERAEIKAVLENATINTYLQRADDLLTDNRDSLAALEEAEKLYAAAAALRPNDTIILRYRDLARRFLTAQDSFNNARWSAAIEDMSYVVGESKDYANGTARQILYEAYLARGDSQMASGLHEQAIEDYRAAAVLAEQDSGALFRLYEIQLKMAEAHSILGNYEDSVRLYRYAVEISRFREREKPALIAKIDEAENLAFTGNYRNAARNYNEAIQGIDRLYQNRVHVVELGQYLSQIAVIYGSTVSAIVDANGIENPNRIFAGQELNIPILNR